jgi:hypothetical protein
MSRLPYVTIIWSSQNVGDDPTDPWGTIRCSCGKKLAKPYGRMLVMANTRIPTEIPIGVPAIEIKCPGCNALYSIIWQ